MRSYTTRLKLGLHPPAPLLFFLLAQFNLSGDQARLSPNKSVFVQSQHFLRSAQLIGLGGKATPPDSCLDSSAQLSLPPAWTPCDQRAWTSAF